MYYSFDLKGFPQVEDFYSITRDTVWQISEKDNILIFITYGSCKIIYETEEYILNQGDLFFIPANCEYKRMPIDNTMCTMTYIHFSMDCEVKREEFEKLREEIINDKNRIDSEILVGERKISYKDKIYIRNKNTVNNIKSIEEYISGINLFSDKRQLMCNLQSSGNLCSILVKISSKVIEDILIDSNLSKSVIVPAVLKRVLGYIATHYSEPISLNELAEYGNISKQHLIRYFKRYMKTTPIQYITEYRIFRAKQMFCNYPQPTVKEVSEELGFDNQHYFSSVFLKITGETPTECKKRIKLLNSEFWS